MVSPVLRSHRGDQRGDLLRPLDPGTRRRVGAYDDGGRRHPRRDEPADQVPEDGVWRPGRLRGTVDPQTALIKARLLGLGRQHLHRNGHEAETGYLNAGINSRDPEGYMLSRPAPAQQKEKGEREVARFNPPKPYMCRTDELDVLPLIARGLSNAEIGQELYISDATVKTHITHILQKLNLRDRVQAVVLAHEARLFATDAQPASNRDEPPGR